MSGLKTNIKVNVLLKRAYQASAIGEYDKAQTQLKSATQILKLDNRESIAADLDALRIERCLGVICLDAAAEDSPVQLHNARTILEHSVYGIDMIVKAEVYVRELGHPALTDTDFESLKAERHIGYDAVAEFMSAAIKPTLNPRPIEIWV